MFIRSVNDKHNIRLCTIVLYESCIVLVIILTTLIPIRIMYYLYSWTFRLNSFIVLLVIGTHYPIVYTL